jgi:hypothetical protein
MNVPASLFRSLILLGMIITCISPAMAERGRDIIGSVTVTLIHACDGQADESLSKFKRLGEVTSQRLARDPRLKFQNYRILGVDQKPLYRSYENWAMPVKGSDDICIRFEAQARPSKELTRLDTELWISQKKILKTGAALTKENPMYVLGPEWRRGRMIVIIELAPLEKTIPDSAS